MAKTHKPKRKATSAIDRSEELVDKIRELTDAVVEAGKMEAYADLEADLTSEDNEHEVYMTGDGVGIEFVLCNWNFTVVKRTWEDIFLGFQSDDASPDAYTCLEMAEAGVAKVQAKLKTLREKFNKMKREKCR